MSYDRETKNKILALIQSGYKLKDISAEYKINITTLSTWKKQLKNKDEDEIIRNIKTQLSNLSKQKIDDKIAMQIAMLTASLHRLEKEKHKKEKAIKKASNKPAILMNDLYDNLRKKALSEFNLFEYQKRFLLDNSQFRIVLKARQIGFSYVSSLDALLGAVAGRNQLFLSASEEQAFILMRYLEEFAKKLNITFKQDSQHEKILENGAYIKVLAHNYRTAQGFTGDIWMDEFAWYPNPKRIWHAFVPSIGAVQGRLTILSTPFEEQSMFYELYMNETKYYMFSRHKVTIYDAMRDGFNFDIETMKSLFDADTFASAYECQFIDDESALLPVALIKECVEDYKPTLPNANIPLYAGFDIGRTKDRSVLISIKIENDIKKIAEMQILSKASFEEQENTLKAFMRLYPLSVLKIDKTGIGMATAEKLKSLFPNRVFGVYFTQSTKEALALNLKKHFEDKTIRIPNDAVLIADLHAIKRKAGQKTFIYDSDRNEHGHADRFWALALALSFFEKVRERKNKVWII